jgi:hypothetical protein
LKAQHKISKSPVPPAYQRKMQLFEIERKRPQKTLKTTEKRHNRVFSEIHFLGQKATTF